MTPRPMYMQIPVEEYNNMAKKLLDAAAVIIEKDKEIENLKNAQRWRKTSEGFPKENDYYIVTNGDFVDFEYGCYSEQDEEWQWEHNGKWEYWMPLPEPPEVK